MAAEIKVEMQVEAEKEAEKDVEEKMIGVEVQAVVKKVKKGTLSVEREKEADKLTEKEVNKNAQEVEVKAERAVEKGVGAEQIIKKKVKEEDVKVYLEVAALTCQGLTSTMEGC